MPADPVAITRELLRCPSVTPAEGGALSYLETTLKAAGFTVHRKVFSEPGTDDVENFYARIGLEPPHLTFAGHTDVVPTGDEKAWTHPPFGGDIDNGELYGRGAVDMKGGIGCAVAAVLDHLAANGGKPKKGSISFLITGDEESIAVNGTPKLLQWVAGMGEKFDHCIRTASRATRTKWATPSRSAAAARSTAISLSPASRVTSPIRSAPTNPGARHRQTDRRLALGAARCRQRQFPTVEPRIRFGRCRQQDRQPDTPARRARCSTSASTTATRWIR